MPPRTRDEPITFNQRPDCPGPELVAAYADGRRLWGHRRRLEAHFADCDRCFTLLAEVQEYQAADPQTEEAEEAPLRLIGGRARRWRPALLSVGGGLAAAAAAMVMSVLLRDPAQPELTSLIAAVGTNRVTEARLAGFSYGRSPDVLRSTENSTATRLPLEAEAVIADMQEHAAAATTPEAIHALGMSRIIAGDLDGGLQHLQRASTLQPDNPRFLSDLAAAYLTRGTRQNHRDDLQQALDHATQAIARDGRLLDARFNRALALDKLGDREAARAAWNDYLALDPASEWANEARYRLTQ